MPPLPKDPWMANQATKAVGDCYNIAFLKALDFRASLGWWTTRDMRIIHAYVTPLNGMQGGPQGDRPTGGHAWIELKGIAFDFAMHYRCPADVFRKAVKAADVREYTLRQLIRLIRTHDHYGIFHGPDLEWFERHLAK